MKRAATDVSMATDTIPMTTAVTGDAQTPPVGVPRAGEGGAGGSLSPAKKQKATKKKKKKDPNEPQKPVSAYALFFRDTQAAIKGQNPSASFGEVSKIVASMWDGLDPAHKEVYKKKTELAKKEYLKQLAAYRASQVSQSAVEEANTSSEKSPSPPSVQPMSISATSVPSSTTITHSYVDMQAMQQQQQQQMQQQQLQQQQMQQQQLQHHQYTAPQTQMEVTPTFHTLTPTTSTTDPIMPALDNGLFPQSAMQESPSNISMMCVRDGCGNLAIENPGWDAEYCSNECVVTHCRDIFTAWVASRGGSSSYPVK